MVAPPGLEPSPAASKTPAGISGRGCGRFVLFFVRTDPDGLINEGRSGIGLEMGIECPVGAGVGWTCQAGALYCEGGAILSVCQHGLSLLRPLQKFSCWANVMARPGWFSRHDWHRPITVLFKGRMASVPGLHCVAGTPAAGTNASR